MKESGTRQKWTLHIIGLLGLVFLGWGYFHAQSGSDDWRSYVYSHPRLIAVALGLLPSVWRFLPNRELRKRLNSAILDIYARLYDAMGVRGVIVVSMVIAYLFTVLLLFPVGQPQPQSIRQFLAAVGYNFGIVFWFAGSISFHGRRIIQEERLQENGARKTLHTWKPFFCGHEVGVCRVVLTDHGSGHLGLGTSGVLGLLKARVDTLKMAASQTLVDVEKVNTLEREWLPEDADHRSVRKDLELQQPTIVVGGPRSNPLTRAFLTELQESYESTDPASTPLWRLDRTSWRLPDPSFFVTPPFIELTDNEGLGIYVEQLGLSLHRTTETSGGLVYFAWRNGNPLALIAGFDRKSTLPIAQYVLNRSIPEVKEWAEGKRDHEILEVWIQIGQESLVVKGVRTYVHREHYRTPKFVSIGK